MARASTLRQSARKPSVRLSLEEEVAHLRILDLSGLQARWQSVLGRPAPQHLPKHLLFGMLAYRVQVDALGGVDATTVQLLKQAVVVTLLDEVLPLVAAMDQRKQDVVPGTVLTREWNGQQHRVMVVDDGFAFEGKTFDSLSKIAFAITGTNWNGPRFFGLRAARAKEARS